MVCQLLDNQIRIEMPNQFKSIILLLNFCISNIQTSVSIPKDLQNYPRSVIENIYVDAAELIRRNGYPVEMHYVVTADKYVLGIHRIPNRYGKPFLFQHGLMDSSDTWILMGADSAPAYYYHDLGYDIWLGNARGNRYSRRHETLNPDTNSSFWKFSWHEIGYYDLPAMIDYILRVTNNKNLTYVGHSQGTTAFFVMCSMLPEFNDKITLMHALAPVAFMKNIRTSLTQIASAFARPLQSFFTEFFPYNADRFLSICFASEFSKALCLNVVYNVNGENPDQLNMTMLPLMFSHFPAGISFNQIAHYLQLIESGRFAQYDYGSYVNRWRYGTNYPPNYHLANIHAPIALYYGANDLLSSDVDVQYLANQLPNVVENFLSSDRKWTHLDSIWGIDAREHIHKRILEIQMKFTDGS